MLFFLCCFAAFFFLAVKKRRVLQLLLAIEGMFLWVLLELSLNLNAVGFVHGRVPKLLSVFLDEIRNDSAKLPIGTFLIIVDIFEAHFLVGFGIGEAGRIAEGQYMRKLVEGGLIGGGLVVLLLTIASNALTTMLFPGIPWLKEQTSGFSAV